MQEECHQIENSAMESDHPTLKIPKRCLDGEHHTVVVIENKGLVECLSGGHSLILLRTTNTLGRPPDPSKLINLTGDLKIKRQSVKVKKISTLYMRSDSYVGNKLLNDDDLGHGVT
ncbi:hypothetical protein Scep_019026 [Stephania cephalantha]|uniref:Uncharacterized protein n=1 Tax=Stephania cephalantha TaxID=152367 RepID=A0AAP0IAA1_9MAGN